MPTKYIQLNREKSVEFIIQNNIHTDKLDDCNLDDGNPYAGRVRVDKDNKFKGIIYPWLLSDIFRI